jgi:hypothetical protein
MKRGRLVVLALSAPFLAFVLLTCSGGSDSSNDCAEFNPPAKNKLIGQSCVTLTYGTCPTKFTDCAQGDCFSTKNGSICTQTCTRDADCPSSYYCRPSGNQSVCTKAATCTTFCDGTTCCTYTQCPNDPTSCCQVSCRVQELTDVTNRDAISGLPQFIDCEDRSCV